MKWRVDIEYEDGSLTEPRRIFFQAVYDGEPYHGYETKREALEAFCLGQYAINQLRKEREAEQKKEEPKSYPTFEAEQKETKEALRKMLNEDLKTPDVETRLEALEKKVEGLEKGLAQLTDTFYICANNETHNYEDLRKKVEKLESEVLGDDGCVGLVSMIYDLRLHKDCEINSRKALERRVEELEKKHRRLLKDYKTHLAFNHNYTMTPKDMELIRQYEPEE